MIPKEILVRISNLHGGALLHFGDGDPMTVGDLIKEILALQPKEAKPDTPVVLHLGQFEDADKHVASLRRFAVAAGWFEVPATNGYERLRMIDGATGGVFVVYEGKRGVRATANVGQPAAQLLLRGWEET
jgi:hypothetical protein